MWAIAQVEIKKQLLDKSLLFWTLLLPVIFIIVFMMIFAKDAENPAAIAGQIITGFSVFFSIFIIISIVISFVKDREKGLVARLASTPLTSGQYFVGKWFPFVIIVFAQIVILSVVGIIVYNMQIEQPYYYFLILVCLAVMVTSWGVAIAVFSKTENTGIVVTQLIAFIGAVLGGLWMPFEILPQIIQTIGKFLPLYWAHQALISTVSTATGGENIGIALLVLLGYTIAGFSLAFAGYRKFLRHSRS